MQVKAAPGLKCPMEGKPREYITDSETVTVPDSIYYIRLVDDGSLVAQVDNVAAKTTKASAPAPVDASKGGDA